MEATVNGILNQTMFSLTFGVACFLASLLKVTFEEPSNKS